MVNDDLKIANFWQRLASLYLNIFFLLLFTALIVALVYGLKVLDFYVMDYRFWLLTAAVFLGLLVLDAYGQGVNGSNFAKALLGLRLVDYNEYSTIGLMRSLLRTLFSAFSILLLGLGFIAIAFNKESRSLHDLLAGSRVVVVSKSMIVKIFSGLLSFFTIIIGLPLTLALAAFLFFLPVTTAKSFMDFSHFSSFEARDFIKQPNAVVNLPLGAGRVFALSEYRNIDYIEFDLNKINRDSYIQESMLELLGVNLLDYDYALVNWQENIRNVEVKRAIVLPRLIIKDKQDKDLVIYNAKFIIDKERNEFGRDILELFDYRIDHENKLLELKLYKEDQAILADANYSDESKKYLLYMLRKIRFKWLEYLKYLPVDTLKEFSNNAKALNNAIDLEIELKTGFVKHVILTNPNDSKAFNKLCEVYFNNLGRFRNIPEELAKQGSLKLQITLSYQEVL